MKNRDILKYLIEHQVRKFLKEQDEIPAALTFEDDPVNFILKSYPSLEQNLILLLSNAFKDYITGIYITAPKPTTFKIVLHNGQEFLLTYLGRAYEATILARRYYLLTIGDKEKAIKAVRNLLQLGKPMNIQGPGEELEANAGTEQQPAEGGAGEAPAETTPPEGGSPEEEKTES